MISQYKSGVSTPQPEQPRQQPEQPRQQPPMQILRPDAVNAEIFYPRR
jgi:hypothetical protein